MWKQKEYEYHGMSKTHPEYRIWASMKSRCANPNDPGYFRYGGRGIKVCDRWKESFTAFYEDMGQRPSPRHSLDRIDTDGGYEPDNCRWVLPKTQSNNRRDNRLVTLDGRTQTLTEWIREKGLHYGTVRVRVSRGWSYEDALTPSKFTPNKELYDVDGIKKNLMDWSRESGISWATLRSRIKTGKTMKEALCMKKWCKPKGRR